MIKFSKVTLTILLVLSVLAGCAGAVPAVTTQPATEATTETTVGTTAPETTVGTTAPEETTAPSSFMAPLPEYTHRGKYVACYDMGADGWYYTKTSKEDTQANIDPLLNGEPIVDELGGGKMYVYKTAGADGYAAYRDDLEKAGYSLYAENDLDGNLFATYVNDTHVVTLSYMPGADNELDILIEPMRALPGLKAENVYEDLGIPSSVTLVTCAYIGNTNGMCFIYQLCDGSFILVDSGYGYGYHPGGSKGDGYADYWQNQAKEIYNTLMTLKPKDQEKPVIAAWFFTHPHWDHIGGLIPFADLYGGQVIVEKMILNHPNRDTIQELWRTNATINITYVRLMQEAAAKLGNVPMIEAHAGQTYYIRNAQIDILCTWELQTQVDKKLVSVNEGNSASLIMDVKIAGERMILFGDCGTTENKLLQQLYGSKFLKADFVQPAHHGYNNLKALYQRIDADVVLWPEVYCTNMESFNSPFVGKYNYTHSEGITYIPLPYNGNGGLTNWDGVSSIHESNQVLYWDSVYPFYSKN